MNIFIGMETSGMLRRGFAAMGHDVISCDVLPAEDVTNHGSDRNETQDMLQGRHIIGDVFATLDALRVRGWWPDLAIFHPTCTYLTISAEWAYSDGPYHQRVKPETLVGAARREARERALDDVRRIEALKIRRKAYENPIGVIGTRIRKATQIIQPWQHGDDASKATCLWLDNLPVIFPTKIVEGRLVEWNGKMVRRWSNQTDSGQNRLTPSPDRWKERSRTYPGPAYAITSQWGQLQ